MAGTLSADRNTGTPFVIYVEIGADFKLHKNGWNTATANDLDAMRAAIEGSDGLKVGRELGCSTIGLIGLILVGRQWDAFVSTFLYFFN